MKRLLLLILLFPCLAAADDALSVDLPECPSRLERRSADADGVVLRPGCPLSTAALVRLVEEAFRWASGPGAPPLRGLYLGRLVDYPEWAARLSLAADQSRRWNSRTGKPRDKRESSNAVVADLLNGPAFPDGLRAVFARRGLKPRIGSVEKVLVFPAREALRSLPAGIPPAARLPADAQVWVDLQP